MKLFNPIIYHRFKRYAISFIRHITLKKLLNMCLILIQMLLHRSKIHGYPFFIKIDPANICNLQCLGCFASDPMSFFQKGTMELELYKKIVDQLAPYLLTISLYGWGEPFTNRNIYEMIAYATQRNIGVVISTNMHFIDTDKLIKSRLDRLIVGIDGVTQETYEKFRAHGNLSKVLGNLKSVLDTRKRYKSSLPFIEWQYVITKENYNEVSAAQKLAKDIGVNCFNCIPDLCKRFDEKTRESKYVKTFMSKGLARLKLCYCLWCFPFIEWDGSIMPCCFIHPSHKFGFGNVTKNSFKKVWNSEYYISARNSFKRDNTTDKTGNETSIPDPDIFLRDIEYIDTVCHHCNYYMYLQ
ncbi:MAG: hypothetical protein QG641_905 [Candidatus Poribacteria bacterium]|nr:hypothetical protein [Candidatus Poribacteria bacterium]